MTTRGVGGARSVVPRSCARGEARAQPQPGGENDGGAFDAHQISPQLRMLEMVPDIWSAAWMTFEFIS